MIRHKRHIRLMPPHAASPHRWQPLVVYSLALMLTIATFFLRQILPVSFGERPLLILFMFPIIASALLGGFGSGLLATSVAAAGTAYFFIPPAGSFVIAASHDLIQWSMLIINGVLVSMLSKFLHHSRQQETARWHQLAATRSQLKESETRFQATFEHAAVGIAMVYPDGRWLRANRKLCDIVGYNHDELLTKTFHDITHPEDLKTDLVYVQQILAGEIETYSMEKRYFRKDGDPVWINLTVALVRNTDGNPDYFIKVIEDIQRRKEAETALLASAAILQEAQHLAGVGNWTWNLQTNNHTWSEEIYRIYGRDLSLPPADYREVQTYFTPESWVKLNAAVEQSMAEGVSYECDAEVVRPDGFHRWITARGEAMLDADKNVITLHGTVQDITKRKQVEQALRESEERLAGIVNTAMDAVISVDEQQRVQLFNPAAGQMFRMSAAEAVGQPLAQLIPERFREAHEDHIRDFARTGTTARRMGVLREISGLRANGEEFPIEASISQSGIGGGKLFTVILRDITDRKIVEENLRKSRAQLMSFIQYAPISIAMFDRDMNYLATSGRWLMEYGRGNEVLDGRNHYQVHPDLPDEWKHIHQQGQAGLTLKNDEELWIQADGSQHWLRWAVLPWTDEDGAIGGIIISKEDITSRKRAEEELLRLNADLEQRVIERTAELTHANRELDSFAYAVSHDLRAPLRAMSGFAQALIEDYGSQLQSEAKIYLEQINLASRKMSELIDGLLVLSRSTRGELKFDTIDLSALSERLLAELKKNDPERQVAVQIETGLQTHGNARMIEVVMRNLLGNAWKYTAHAAAPNIRVYAEKQYGTCRFCIADNGAGFDMAYANRLFQPFQRLHRQDEFPGIGIGLATVQRIVHYHGGIIEACGEPGKGAAFCFTLSNMPED